MNILKKKARDLELAQFLCTLVGTKKNGRPRYHTLEEAQTQFDLSYSQCSRLKVVLIDETNGERTMKEGLES